MRTLSHLGSVQSNTVPLVTYAYPEPGKCDQPELRKPVSVKSIPTGSQYGVVVLSVQDVNNFMLMAF